VTFHVSAAWEEDRPAVGRMQMDLLRTIGNIPGVTAAGFANFLPATNATLRYQLDLLGASATPSTGGDHLTVGERSVSNGYFQALGARMVAGTGCPDLAVIDNGAPKALVNRRFVEQYAGGRGVVGRLIHWTAPAGLPASEIVGVVDDIHEDDLRTPA